MFIMRIGNETRKKIQNNGTELKNYIEKTEKSDYRLIKIFNYKKAITKLS